MVKPFSGERWLICGGRDFKDADLLEKTLDTLVAMRGMPDMVIHGKARGADTLAGEWAAAVEIEVHEEPISRLDWAEHGNAAGPVRNQRMLDIWTPDLVVAFPGANGTKDMVARAKRAGIHVIIVDKDGDLIDSKSNKH